MVMYDDSIIWEAYTVYHGIITDWDLPVDGALSSPFPISVYLPIKPSIELGCPADYLLHRNLKWSYGVKGTEVLNFAIDWKIATAAQ